MKEEYKPSELCMLHEKRIHRLGIKFWDFMRNLSKKERVSGLDAMNIMDYCALKPIDVLFLCATHGCQVDVEEFCLELNRRSERFTKICSIEVNI